MRLKALELQGFKTFPDKTKLTFEDGISAVVGPNGSGKSNISDAVRWVLGEQSAKALRCVKMEDVIFSGTPSRKAQGFAEVTLTIDNESRYLPFDGDTVAITRRYYRSGDSEYLINKATVRLKDIHELFMDTGLGRDGYSMIGQGKIDAIISAKSEERREIFEEAAGISRYRYRKEESERKLQRAEENLLRLQDILGELEGRVGPLKEQAEKAREYLALYQEKRRLEIGLWLYTLDQSGRVLQEHEEKITIARNQHQQVLEAAEALDREIEALFHQTNQCLARAEQTRSASAKAEGEAAVKDGEISVLQNDIHHNRETMGRLTAEQTRFQDSEEQNRQLLQEKLTQTAALDKALTQQEDDYQRGAQRLAHLRQTMDTSTGQMELANAQLHRLNEEIARVKVESAQSASGAGEIDLRLSAIDDTAAQRAAEKQKLEQAIADQRQAVEAARTAEEALVQTLAETEEKLRVAGQQNDTAKSQRDKVYLDLQETSRRAKILRDLERNLEGFGHSVKTVMRLSDQGALSGVHGPVSRLLTVPKAYAVAMEVALGSAAQHIVVGTEQDAKAAIQMLKQKDGGRATFLPIATIRGKTLREPGLADCPGFVGVAGDLCQCDSQYDGILQSLLGRIAVAETLDHAVSIAKRFRYQFRIVTLDGQVVNAGGSMTGGSLAKKTGLLSRAADIAALEEQCEALQIRLDEKTALCEKTASSIQRGKAILQETRQKLSQATDHRQAQTAELTRLESDLRGREHQLQELETERQYTARRRGDLEAAQQQAEEQLRLLTAELAAAQADFTKLTGGRNALQEQASALSEELQAMQLALLTTRKDREVAANAVAELETALAEDSQRATHIGEELTFLAEKNTRLESEIETARKASADLREQAEALRNQAETLQQERLSLEQKSVSLRAMEKERSATRETIGQELSRLEERKLNLQRQYDDIISQLWTEYELTRREAESEAEPVEDEGKSAKRLRELKSKIKNLGSVNVSAIEEYQEVSQRYEFLTAQIRDVEQSRTELHKLIRDLTRQMTDIFTQRFQEINSYFSTTFTELFGGGKAHLELSEPEDVLHSGIVILAQPPGKIVKNLELLSGGEKALVAVSLYFAIMKVSPPPFCMLDEIEAALDDVNVVRFADYLRRMNQNTQFIVITHRRGTMEEADVLYGVTMQEEGVSRLLKLDPSEVGSKLGMKETK